MDMISLRLGVEVVFTAVFALAGALVALRGGMDVVGAVFLAMVTAVGGGTLRDVLLSGTPVFWVVSPWPLYVAAAVGLVGFYGWHHRRLEDVWLKVLDGAGLAFFAVLGTERALAAGVGEGVAIVLGVCTGVVGGVIRDVLANQTPFIFRSELYAMCAFAGGVVYVGLPQGSGWSFAAAVAVAFGLRLGGVFLGWKPPVPKS